MMRAVIFLCLGAAQARLLIKSKKTVTPVTEKVTVGGPGAATDVGSDVTYNECFDFTTSVPPIVTVCGTSTKVTMYMRGRCEAYHKYNEEVGACDKTKASDTCMSVDGTTETAGWLKESQSYMITPC